MKMHWCRSITTDYSVFATFGYMSKFIFIKESKKAKYT